MAFRIHPQSEQAQGAFDNGRIQEFKPVGFPGEGSKQGPFSTVFYWAHAFSETGGLIDRHPHRGFEIVSFVLGGKIEHYDSKVQDWLGLEAGDAQIIRSGAGIEHAERLLPGSAMFQVWFDPNLQITLGEPATYTDYRLNEFPADETNGLQRTMVIGPGSPFKLRTSVTACHLRGSPGRFSLETGAENFVGVFVLEGAGELNGKAFKQGDFLFFEAEVAGQLEAKEDLDLFAITAPLTVDYPLYHQR